MKNYYEILGLRATASDREVKQVFRRLAVAYHPDKNPAPEAEAIFKEINEAYEILSDPEKRNLYDQLLNGNESTDTVTSEPTEPWHRDPAYRRRKQSGYKHQPAGPSAKQVMMESFLKYLVILSRAGCVFILLLIIDYLLPSHVSNEKIVTSHEAVSKLIARPSSNLLITEQGHHFPIVYSETEYFQPDSEIKVFSSPIFALLIKVESEAGDYQLNNLATIYRNFVFLPIGLLIFSLAGISSKKEVEFRFNVGIVLILLFLLNIIFFFTSRV